MWQIDRDLLHPNELGPTDIPRFHIAICPQGHTTTYSPVEGPQDPGMCRKCHSLVITIIIPLSLLSMYADVSQHFYRKADPQFSVT